MGGRTVVQVWLAAVRDLDGGVCTPEERQRAQRYRDPARRHRALAARSLVRQVLGERLGLPPDAVPVTVDRHGKPALDRGTHEDLRFSVAHTADLAVVALGESHDVGVDIERWDRPVRWAPIVAQLLSPAEREALAAVPPGRRPRALLAWWVRKEAVVKAHGAGFRLPIQSFEVPLGDPVGVPAAVRSDDPALRGLSVVDVASPSVGAAVAVAAPGTPFPVLAVRQPATAPSEWRASR